VGTQNVSTKGSDTVELKRWKFKKDKNENKTYGLKAETF